MPLQKLQSTTIQLIPSRITKIPMMVTICIAIKLFWIAPITIQNSSSVRLLLIYNTSHYAWTVPTFNSLIRTNDRFLFMNSNSHYSSTILDIIIQNYFCFRWKRFSPSVKAFHLSEFQQSSEESKAPSSLYKEAQVPFLRRFKILVLSIKSQIPPFSLQPNTCNQMAIPSLVYTSNTPVDFYFCNQMASVGLFWWPWADNLLEVLVAQSLFY